VAEGTLRGEEEARLSVLTGDLYLLHGVPVWWTVIGCIYHELFQALCYLSVAGSAAAAYFFLPFRKKDDAR
jgi:hypothetical protein